MLRLRSAVCPLLVAGLFAACSARPTEAAAQTSPDSTAADVLFEEGRIALGRGDLAGACAKFDASRRLEPGVGTLLNLGECSERLARKREAWIAFREALRFMPATDERRSFARDRVAALEAKLGRLVLRVDNAPADVRIVVDGEAISPPYDAPRVVDPGRHEVRVLARGSRERAFAAVVPEGGVVSLVVTPGEPTPPSGPRGDAGSSRRTAGFVVGGVGIAALAGGAGFGIAALASSSNARDRCGGGLECSDASALAAARDEASTATTRATFSTALLASGVVATIVGLYLVLGGGRSSAPSLSASRAVSPMRFEF